MSNNHDLIQQLNNKLQNLPPDVLDASGRFLYSSGATMKKGDYYLIGKFPGGTPDDRYPILRDEIIGWDERKKNAYLKEEWENKGGYYPEGKSPYQLEVQKLCEVFKIDAEDVCASNWILTRSPKSTKMGDKKYKEYLAKIFAPLHEIIMEIVQPKIVLAISNGDEESAYKYVKEHFGFNDMYKKCDGKWCCKVAQRKCKEKPQTLIGFPDFTYPWNSLSKDDREKITSHIARECSKL